MDGQNEIEPGVILERLKNLNEGQTDIKVIVECLAKDFQAFHIQYTEQHTNLVNRTNSAHTRLDNITKWLGWIAMIIGAMIIGLLWNIFTNQVHLIFP